MACLQHISVDHHLPLGVSAPPLHRDACSQRIIGLSRTYPFVLFTLPITTFLEFLLEFSHGICFVRIGFLIFLLGFILFFG